MLLLTPNRVSPHPNPNHRLNNVSLSGFTLIEMLVVLIILAILIAIAIPSYRQYMIRNAESQALAQMKQTELELESWRANTLSYKGFFPKRLENATTPIYAYADSRNITINVPTTNPNYIITLATDSTGSTSLATQSPHSVANTWYMYATPTAQLQAYGAKAFLITSNGIACKGAIAINSDCKNAGEVRIDKS